MKSGVYIITNILNNKIYIGSSKNLRKRLSEHINNLKKNKHENFRLQNSVNKYGIENFTFEILEFHDLEYIISMEQYWMNILNTVHRDYGFNINPKAGSSKGFSKEQHSQWGTHRSEETKLKLSISHTGKKMSEEHKLNSAKGHFKPVLQLDKITEEVIQEFESVKSATEFFNGGQGTLTKVLKKPNYTAFGFKWSYKTK